MNFDDIVQCLVLFILAGAAGIVWSIFIVFLRFFWEQFH